MTEEMKQAVDVIIFSEFSTNEIVDYFDSVCEEYNVNRNYGSYYEVFSNSPNYKLILQELNRKKLEMV
jgi:hypothetical protein